jgi:hypothetical protein
MATNLKKPFVSEAFVRRLLAAEREILVQHIDVALDVNRSGNHQRAVVVDELISMKLLRDEKPGPFNPRPRRTVLTEDGRQAVATILAGYAEALVLAGCGSTDQPTAMQVLERLKAARDHPAGRARGGLEGQEADEAEAAEGPGEGRGPGDQAAPQGDGGR